MQDPNDSRVVGAIGIVHGLVNDFCVLVADQATLSNMAGACQRLAAEINQKIVLLTEKLEGRENG
jgi:hypothetical protein